MVEIQKHEFGRLRADFFDVVDHIYREDPAYIRPLDMEVKDRCNPKKNPFFEHGEGVCFTAHQSGRCVGRISAQIDRAHLERYKDGAGFFGLFDTIEDQEVAGLLLSAAEGHLRGLGMGRVRGPFSLSINDEMGCLIDGFGKAPYMMMPYHRPYQSRLIEACGYQKLKDVYAWKYDIGTLPPRVARAREAVAAMSEVTSRVADTSRLEEDVAIIARIFNDAWQDNWGFVPITDREIRKMAEDFKLILIPELTRIVSIHGEPAAVAVAVPNLNEMVADLRGKLFPFGIVKMLYRLKVRGPSTARLIILGISKKYRYQRRYAPLSVALFGDLSESARTLGIREGELGWTLEDNHGVNNAIKVMGGSISKTYRVFQKELGR